MIAVQLNKRDFEYDIHSLIRAFYPGMDVPVYQEAEPHPEGWEKKLVVDYQPDKITLVFQDSDGQILAKREQQVEYEADRKATKNVLKSMLYELLRDYTGQDLPWGNLTGIRPTKIPMALLEQGWKNTEIADYMRKTYYTSNEKTALSIMIANRERHILKDINYENGYSLYVGIPFCPSICLYCSFSSSPLSVWKNKVDTYLDALCKEIEACARIYRNRKLDTIYMGGGTPTTLEPYQMDRLLTKIEECFDRSYLKEFTVEAGRPDSITREKLEVLRKHGISRISINPQTMNQSTLDIIGRRHTVEQTVEAFHLARELGFDNINMDLIVGLPGEEYEQVEHTMKEVTALDPDSITVHSLAVKRAARLNMFKDQYKEMTFTNNQQIMEMTARYAYQAGHSPYYLYRQKNMAGNFENVGYAKPDSAGIYNILIMEEKQSILALGAGATSKKVSGELIERTENVKDIKNYVERIDEMIERKRLLMETDS
ncbi:Oxygen-independent coproporphyrinogen-III oxidase 2 [uncultured Clostridium sp.]|uniref:Coproporphyrinogen dehydrogenase HemZ n=1 Tax=Muricoprocola aceti TaxID=2981772 RepID=A0ABT2SL52_9FIRM|nr:coproporphyrinogen dehydrogenase HemZ [Muricoprocola aceti]MCU6725219.1 coproporphyrinogen dehydrogenase HemZ [Muricoprocola aceti]SCH43237.1 Oxygen-independent coproporphyrinogen-III oxidase 2 [uncultured Clostridium sp.]